MFIQQLKEQDFFQIYQAAHNKITNNKFYYENEQASIARIWAQAIDDLLFKKTKDNAVELVKVGEVDDN